ncbi:Uncharacterised protein [Bordetella pertussis]|nr:Uncharacterised protein [Bordetella pertussis]
MSVACFLAALTMSGSSCPGAGTGPRPMMPFSEWKKMVLPSGIWLATRMGKPIPRLTMACSGKSTAIRAAISSFDQPLLISHLHYPVDEYAGRMDVVGIDTADGNHLLGLGDGRARRHGHDGIESPAGAAIPYPLPLNIRHSLPCASSVP